MISSLVLFLSSFLTPFMTFLFIGLVSRNSTVDAFSDLSLALVIIAYFNIFSDFGSKDYFLTKEKPNIYSVDFFSNVIKVNLILIFIICLVINIKNKDLGSIIFSLYFEFILTSFLLKSILLRLQIKDKASDYRYYNLLLAVSVPSVKYLIFFITNDLILSLSLSGILGLSLVLFFSNKNDLFSILSVFRISLFDYIIYVKSIRLWYPFLMSTLSFFLYFNSDKLIIAWKLSSEDLAVYTIATTIMSIGEMASTVAWMLLIPKMNVVNKCAKFRKNIRSLSFFGGFSFFILSYALSDELIVYFFGVSYLEAYSISVLLSLYFIFRYWNITSEIVLISSSKAGFMAKARLFCGLFNVAVNLLFIERYGLYFAALSTILSELILMGLLSYEIKK